MGRKSKLVCKRCGQPVIGWRDGWKHATGGRSDPTCGKPPIPVDRAQYEAEIDSVVDAVLEKMPWRKHGDKA